MINFTPQEKLLSGITTLERAVATTLGPRGCNVGIDEGFRKRVVHDGVTVARNVTSQDKDEEFGIRILHEAAEKTVMEVGDGTTVTTILASEIIKECYKRISANVHPMSLRPQLEEGLRVLLKELDNQSTPLTDGQLSQVATISSNDPQLGELISNTLLEVGKDGVITVEEGKTPETTVEHESGMVLEHGYASPYFITNAERMIAELHDTKILLTDMEMNNFSDLFGFLDEFISRHHSLIVIAPSFEGDVMASFIKNKLGGKLISLLIKAPLFGDTQRDILEDIAALTGATVLSREKGMTFDDLTLSHLGTVQSITAERNATVVVGGGDVSDRIDSIKTLMKTETDWKLEKLRERLAKLTSGVAVVRVGGETEIEMNERVERVKDAVGSSQAAMRSGVVPGGETIYLKIRQSLPTDHILYSVLDKPFVCLMENAGLNSGQMMERMESANDGVDVRSGELVDLLAEGILDPTAVPRSALKNAVSVAIQIITTQAIITPEEEKK